MADRSAERAFLSDRAGRIVGLELSHGRILWRSDGPLHPLLVHRDRLIAVRTLPPRLLQVVVLAAPDGRELLASRSIAMPEWANLSGRSNPDLILDAEATNGGVVLRWELGARYRGGAPPGALIRQQVEKHASGSVRLDLETGALDDLEPADSSPMRSRDQESAGAMPPDVLDARDVAGRRFALVGRPGPDNTIQLVVRAIDLASGQTLWETVIDEGPRQRPPALRQ